MKPPRLFPLALITLVVLIAQPFIVRAELPEFVTITGQVTNENGYTVSYPSVIAVANGDTLGAYYSNDKGTYKLFIPSPFMTAVEEDAPGPETFQLHQNYPNPFNPSTTITFELSRTDNITLTVYSITGQRIATLYDGQASAGLHRVTWNGYDESGNHVGSGLYFYRLVSGGAAQTKKMLLLDSGITSTGGAPLLATYQDTYSTAAKPAELSFDIIVAKPGYTTSVIPHVVITENTETLAMSFTLAREPVASLRIPLGLDTVWEYYAQLKNGYGGMYTDSISEMHTTRVVGSVEIDSLEYFQLDNWPPFVLSAFRDPDQVPLIRDDSEGNVYVYYNQQDILIIHSGDSSGKLVQFVELVNGDSLYIESRNNGGSGNTIFDSFWNVYSTTYDVYHRYVATGGVNIDHLFGVTCDFTGTPICFSGSQLDPTNYLKRMTSGSRIIGIPPDITPDDGIQARDLKYLIKRVVDPVDGFDSGRQFHLLVAEGLPDPSLIPVLPYQRFYLTTKEEIQEYANTYHTTVGFLTLTFSQSPEDEVTVCLTTSSISYEENEHGCLGGEGAGAKFIPGNDMWYWNPIHLFYDCFY